MKKRRLGQSDLRVTHLGLGTSAFGTKVGPLLAHTLLNEFVGNGLNLVDTADVYPRSCPGEAERIIGAWFKKTRQRQHVIVATKTGTFGLKKTQIIRAAEQSLARLRTDYIDLLQAHIDDPRTPLEETLEAFSRLIETGKVRAIGVSNFTPRRVVDCLDVSTRCNLPRYQSVQQLYNLHDGYWAEESFLMALCQKCNLGFLAYSPLASGFLSDKYTRRKQNDWPESLRRYQDKRGARILSSLRHVALELDCSPAQAALAWVLTNRYVTSAVTSFTQSIQLRDAISALRLALPATQRLRLDIAASRKVPSTAIRH